MHKKNPFSFLKKQQIVTNFLYVVPNSNGKTPPNQTGIICQLFPIKHKTQDSSLSFDLFGGQLN